MKEMLNSLFSSIDCKDADAFVALLTENARFRFANSPMVIGRKNIHNSVSGFFSGIKALRHKLINTWQVGDIVICEGEVTYTRHDDTSLSLPFVDILQIEGSLIADYRIYMDISSLF